MPTLPLYYHLHQMIHTRIYLLEFVGMSSDGSLSLPRGLCSPNFPLLLPTASPEIDPVAEVSSRW